MASTRTCLHCGEAITPRDERDDGIYTIATVTGRAQIHARCFEKMPGPVEVYSSSVALRSKLAEAPPSPTAFGSKVVTMTTKSQESRTCAHCQRPIASGDSFYTVGTPTGPAEIHAECLAKGTRNA